ncbi:DUF1207 domain-containing protein [Candidatus Laterigemmans baculatus]|uniref:DUF1207 domain-containing protein n=1 Tax=Candidatus Laterigemmans baculatus TaxID=2770505 RepID=UPI0013DD7DBD|nr:DUF1207 domain-containing protein [Candidatus Laterigemmans baculatus]
MHRHHPSFTHCGHRSAGTVIAVPATLVYHSRLQLLAVAKLSWVYLLVAAAVWVVFGNGRVRGAEADDRPDMAAYYEAASPAPVPRVATAAYGDAPVEPSEGRIVSRPGWLSTMASEFGEGSFSSEDFASTACQCGECNGYHWEFLPDESLYPFYLADTKASRLAGQWIEATDDGTLLDGTLGGRFGIFRYVDATPGPFKRGVQADIEGSAQVRLDMDREHDVRAVDFRAGVPIAVSFGRFQTRFGYYHLSSHVGDEFLIRLPTFDRLNYSRDVLFIGGAYWLTEQTRIYGEAGWAFYYDVCEPWEFTFGIESAPRRATGLRGAPFYAINGRLQEEVDYGGSVTVQAGWAWRSGYDTGLLRTGLHYYNGKSNQFSFYDDHEELIGAGLWYDF